MEPIISFLTQKEIISYHTKANYWSSKYLENEMNGDPLLYLGFLHGNPNSGFKQIWKRKINVWQQRDGPVVDLGDTADKTAGALVKVCSLNLKQDAVCHTKSGGLREEEVSPLWHFVE